MIIEINIPWPSSIVQHETLIALWSFILAIPGQHALYTHADAFDVLHWTPTLSSQEIETNDAVGVDMRYVQKVRNKVPITVRVRVPVTVGGPASPASPGTATATATVSPGQQAAMTSTKPHLRHIVARM
ncbi:hypothetical protein B7463_g287, partial [Scytalidium lignicola]